MEDIKKVFYIYPAHVRDGRIIGYGHILSNEEEVTGKIYLGDTAIYYEKGITETIGQKILEQDNKRKSCS